jgi:exopolyphosphatase / guanosine-5'-triphosphate,3'-diphosphate pyrophosphatase
VARDGHLVLKLPGDLAALASERLMNRLRQLGRLTNLEPRVELV